MLVDAYAIFDDPIDAGAVTRPSQRAYTSSPFVRVLAGGRAPSVPAVAEPTMRRFAWTSRDAVVRAICAIDNLGKGAAGQAVQNLNLMLWISRRRAD